MLLAHKVGDEIERNYNLAFYFLSLLFCFFFLLHFYNRRRMN